ncbi:MAG: radical SAM protein, partial [Deltaproteobacteria bacterium]|nr:radical SAM protein [Deltaproteobacteria bacterium]
TRTHRRPFIIPIFLPHSGCPHQCAFCNQKSIAGTSSHPLSPQAFHRLVENFLEFKGKRDKTTQIAFFGGNFLGQKKETIQALLIEAETYIKTGRVDAIRFSTRPDTIDEDRLSLIKKHTVSTIELGVQSMDNRVLDLSNRGHTALDTQNAVFLLKKSGYEIGLQMMVGLPGDNTTQAMATAERMAALLPDFIRIYPTVVLNGSPLAKVYRAGNYTPLPLYACVTLVK